MPLMEWQTVVDPEQVRLARLANADRRLRTTVGVIAFLLLVSLLIGVTYRYAVWRNAYIAALPEQRADLVSITMTDKQNDYIITMVQNGQERNVELTAWVVPEGGKPDGGVRGAIVFTTGPAPGYVRFKQVDAAVPFPGLGFLKLQPGIYDFWAYTSKPFVPTK